MSTEIIIRDRMRIYTPRTVEEERAALKEMLQEIVLYGLSTTSFFDEAIFHGGTSLRILYNLPRFSEDLDFILKSPNLKFHWQPYLLAISNTCKEFGIHAEVKDKSEAGKTVQKMFLKDSSIGKLLNLHFHHHKHQKLMIKLEIDTNPPKGSVVETKFLSFPLDCAIVAQDLSSNFAGKCHALLCREYVKGRDWFDFVWYINHKVLPNLKLLKSALYQQGPWAREKINLDSVWLRESLMKKIQQINWSQAVADVKPFIGSKEQQVLSLWGKDFFLDKLQKLEELSE